MRSNPTIPKQFLWGGSRIIVASRLAVTMAQKRFLIWRVGCVQIE